MKIVAPDGVRLNEDQQLRLRVLGELRLFSDLPRSQAELVDRLKGAAIVLLNEVPIGSGVLRELPGLKMLSLWSAGYNHVDLQAAKELGIVVCHAPGCSADPIAEHAIGAAIYFLHHLGEADRQVRSGRYDWRQFVTPELRGRVFGVVDATVEAFY